jgi:hypothetical protein
MSLPPLQPSLEPQRTIGGCAFHFEKAGYAGTQTLFAGNRWASLAREGDPFAFGAHDNLFVERSFSQRRLLDHGLNPGTPSSFWPVSEGQTRWRADQLQQREEINRNKFSAFDLPPLHLGEMLQPLLDDDLLSEMLDDTRF